MAVWSNFFRATSTKLFQSSLLVTKKPLLKDLQSKCMSSGHERMMEIKPSNWQWERTKDFFHLYFMVGAIPITTAVFLVYIFVGPATLEPIPEGYTPKHWEYYKNPITRFLARYTYRNPQQEYEVYLGNLYIESRAQKVRQLESRVHDLMSARMDYPAYYYKPYMDAKYIYLSRYDKEHEPKSP